MATLTSVAQIDNAIRLYKDAQSMYFAIGGSTTEWPNKDVPPIPPVNQETIPELIGVKKVSTVSLAIETTATTGTNVVSYGGKNYQLVGLADAYTKGATFVYIASAISSSDFSSPIYRVVALTNGPTFSQNVVGDAIPASNVTSQGRLQVIDNIPAVDRSALNVNEFVIIEAK